METSWSPQRISEHIIENYYVDNFSVRTSGTDTVEVLLPAECSMTGFCYEMYALAQCMVEADFHISGQPRVYVRLPSYYKKRGIEPHRVPTKEQQHILKTEIEDGVLAKDNTYSVSLSQFYFVFVVAVFLALYTFVFMMWPVVAPYLFDQVVEVAFRPFRE